MMDLVSLVYMLAFALCGILIARPVFRRDDPFRRVFFGLVFGLVMLIWLPTLFAFIFRSFNLLAQLAALALAMLGAAAATVISAKKYGKQDYRRFNDGEASKKLVPLLLTALPLIFICFTLHINHTIVNASDGSLHVGQCTYGDLCMHLGFITSISAQKTFPPMYSLLPGTPLGYPFLCDSVSSTFYTLGASLRWAALLPALYACLVTVLGVYFFFDTCFKKTASAVLATYMFFIGGGFGFWYFFNNKQILAEQGVDRMKELMTGFYKMPTNLPDEGLRWVNAIADMLLPQRATLFGWALLFPALQLLWRGAIENERRVFIPLGVIAGALPLVHTHSFLALGIISVVLFVAALLSLITKRQSGENARLAVRLIACFIAMLFIGMLRWLPIPTETPGFEVYAPLLLCAALSVACAVFSVIAAVKARKNGRSVLTPVLALISSCALGAVACLGIYRGDLFMLLAPAAGIVLFLLLAFLHGGRKTAEGEESEFKNAKKNLLFFVLFGVITLVLACPQLFGFTLKQSGGSSSFLRWNFNWDNRSDSWLWFYIKNLGLIFILMLPAFLFADKKHRLFYGGGLAIWLICEILLFQPNPYDNNKLLFVWFALSCGIVADYLVSTLLTPVYTEINGEKAVNTAKTAARRVLFVIALASIFTSGVMTLAREYVSADHIDIIDSEDGKRVGVVESGYEVVSANLVQMTEWVKENTEPDAVFLTKNNHNNAIAMLTGRNLFCGSGTFLHWHGVDFRPRQQVIGDIFTDPETYLEPYAKEYGIDYILVSSFERSYTPDMVWLRNNLERVYEGDDVEIFRVDLGDRR